MSSIPFDLFHYRTQFGRFYTYWGDIYSGTLHEASDNKEGFFIVPNHQLQEVDGLSFLDRTTERMRELGWEIRDARSIVDHYPVGMNDNEFSVNHGPTISYGNQDFSEMYIFGAGASANCCFGNGKERYVNDPWRSPLGDQIFSSNFDVICRKYHGVLEAIPHFELRNSTIEECLEDDWQKIVHSFRPDLAIRHLNLQFYLQELFRIISSEVVKNHFRFNLFNLFAEHIKTKTTDRDSLRPIIVNFNYDTILDHYLDMKFGYSSRTLNDYIDWDERRFVHFKPHGSCNWGWVLSQQQRAHLTREPAGELYRRRILPWQLYYEILGTAREMVNGSSYGMEMHGKRKGRYSLDKLKIEIVRADQVAYPALLLPFKEKDEFVMPYYHQTALNVVLPKVQRLVVIGWKGSEQLFLNHLKEKGAGIEQVVVVNPSFEEVKSVLSPYLPKDLHWIHVHDFEAYVKGLISA